MGYEHDSLVVTPGSDFSYYLLDDCDVEKEFSYEYELISDSVEAPVKNGQVVGTVRLLRNGELVGTADLIVRANVSRSVSEYYKEQVKSLIFGNFFIKALIVIVCIAVVYILIVSIYKGQKQKKERKRQQEEDY